MTAETISTSDNPILARWSSPLSMPPFDVVRPEHFRPAFDVAMAEHLAAIDAIASHEGEATFENTVVALDRADVRLSTVSRLFSNLASAETNPEIQAAERDLSPILANHYSKVALHEGVFARLDDVFRRRSELGLSPVQLRLLERLHLDFVRSGATLTGESRARVSQINEELAQLQTEFSQHVLADESSWFLRLDTPDDCAGLPDWFLDAARSAAAAFDLPEGTAVVTLSRSLVTPFLSLSTRRDLREIAWRAWTSRGENGGATDTRGIIGRILVLRRELALLFGYETFAEYQIADSMAKSPTAVSDLLHRTWAPARASAIAEYEELNRLARSSGGPEVEAWDWRFYAEQIRKERYDLDDEEVKPYFSLEDVLAAAFDCAGELFGLSFAERADLPTYHPDVRTFEVRNAEGHLLGVFLSDNYARPTKRSGAWMSSYRMRADYSDGDLAIPIIANHNNFAKASGTVPTLLSLDDARTLFHEFGHGLHGLLSASPFRTLAGTNVLRDFVELPSQLFEHWLLDPAVLRRHARHFETREPMPEDLLDRIQKAAHFNQGFETVEFVSSALVDLALHQLQDVEDLDLDRFEQTQLAELGMPPAMVLRHRLPHFLHLFASSGYASSYYVYLWAEVLDADAFDAFSEAGDPFDQKTAERLFTYVYSSGDTIEPGDAYRRFRGRDAAVEPMLRGRGLLT